MNSTRTHPFEQLSLFVLRSSVFLTEQAIRHKAVLLQVKEIGLIGSAAGLAYIFGRVVGHFLQAALS